MQSLLFLKSKKKQPFHSFLPYLRYKRLLFSCVFTVVILIVAACFSFSKPTSDGMLQYRQSIEVLSYTDGLHISVNETVLDKVVQAQKCLKYSASLDGTTAAFLTDNKELFLVKGQKLLKIADDVLHFEISSSGRGIAFAQKYAKQNALTLYSLKDETRREITTLLSRLDFSLSPDGETLAYYTQLENEDVLMCYRKGQSVEICRNESDLVGLSDDGKYIYAVCPQSTGISMLYFFNYRGHGTALGPVTSISFKFNHDHRQIMFYDNGNTMISTNGHTAEIVSNYPLYLVTAPNSQSASDENAITLPVATLFDHIYTCSDGATTSAWLIRKDPQKSEKLVSRVSACTLDASAEFLYFIQDHEQLCMMNIAKGISKIQVLAENADNYVFTSNRKKIYYTDNGALYCTNGRKSGKDVKLITDDFSGYRLVMGASNSLYYLNGTDVFVCRNGRRSECVIKDITSIYNSSNQIVYFIGEDDVYIANNNKQPVRILGSD